MSKAILEELRLFREKQGMSQEQFADVLGMSVRTLQEYEHYRRMPSRTIASYFDLIVTEPVVFDLLKKRYDEANVHPSDIAKFKEEIGPIRKRRVRQESDAYQKLAEYIITGVNK